MASFMAGVAANVSASNTVVTTDIVEPYVRPGQADAWYVRFGRIATISGIVVAMGTALIASTYDNLMNDVPALFSIFNAPLFATFIIGMFWRRMTPAAGFWGLVAGTAAAAITWIGYKAGWFDFGSDLSESMWGAGAAFAVDALVTVAVSLRRVIGGSFVAYGLLLAILGLFASDAEIDRAAGVNINLFGGLAMLAFGLLMLVWAFTRPMGDELTEAEGGEHPKRAAPRGLRPDALRQGASA